MIKIYDYKSQFGWQEDNGIGDRLIGQIIRGEKTATASPKSLYTPKELSEIYASVGKPATVIDKNKKPRCNILIQEVFDTNFGSPDPRLVAGEGYGDDVVSFKRSHRAAWQDLVDSGKLKLDDETVLVVEIFKLVT
jgi:uncharacterized protein YhfF